MIEIYIGEKIMESTEFIKESIGTLSRTWYGELKTKILGEYLKFSFLNDEEISLNAFSEKINDYFEKLSLKTGSNFELIIKQYLSSWDALVGKYIAREHVTKKNEAPLPLPRSRKYYNYAMEIRRTRSITMRQLVDYSRVMMCLYSSVIDSNNEVIDDFDYSANFISLEKMIACMKEEKSSTIMFKKKQFDIEDLYGLDTGTFIITMIMYCFIKDNQVEGEQ